MTQEEKDLLLKDLCAKLPYGVKFQLTNDDGIVYNTTLTGIDLDTGIFYGADIDDIFGRCQIENIKPYLRPMSSMTEEEEEERQDMWHSSFSPTEYATLFLDFCNERHLDYRGLIDRGLAISTEVFNPYKD